MLKKITSSILCLIFIISICATQAFALDYEKDMMARIGIVYGNEAKNSHNMFYDAGGFVFGYMDDAGYPVTVYESPARFISVANDKSYDLSGNSLVLGSSIGAYHIELENEYYSWYDAQTAADEFGGFVAYVNGVYKVRIGSFASFDGALNGAEEYESEYGVSTYPAGGTSYGFSVIDMNEGKVIFELEMDGVDSFYASVIAYDQKPQIKTGSSYYYGGFIVYRVTDKLNLINYVSVQDYLKGVVPYEMSNSWPIEALKAQAVAARNYLYQNIGKHSSQGFMVCDNTHCQMYGGTARAGENSDRAVDETDGIVLTYAGKLAELYYHASSGGYTENSENVWFSAIPYLVAVESPYEDLDNINYGRWTYTLSKEQVREKLIAGGYSIGEISEFYVSQYTPAGNVYAVTAVDTSGNHVTITKETARIKLYPYVHSMRFTISGGGNNSADSVFVRGGTGMESLSEPVGNAYAISAAEGVSLVENREFSVMTKSGISTYEKSNVSSDSFVITGSGYGNNVGLSQEGAKGMALLGFTFDQILTHYFQGTSVEYLN